ncbi:MAG: helix-turn-helix transcriptional regulator [Clostridiales bacterium]|nr:helix-turn-helix transcriptional regulator [Clostridiales bacterium]
MSSFPERLIELRAENKLNQKTAAADLNISQALLSHYEKGIRECGLDFLCRAADYYKVTTDYLLGRSLSRNGLSEHELEDCLDDSDFSPSTVYRASIMSLERCNAGSANAGEQITLLYALTIYRTLIAASSSGYIPKRWFTLPVKMTDSLALALTERMLHDFPERAVNIKRKGGSQPLCIETLIVSIEDFIRKTSALKTPSSETASNS